MHEAGQLVAGEKGSLERRVPWHREVLGMREDGLDDDLRIALVTQDRRAVLWVLVERRMDLVVEVVEEGGRAPELLVLVEPARVEAGRRLDGERVTPQRLALRVPGEGVPGLRARNVHRGSTIPRLTSTLASESLMQSFLIEGRRPLAGSVRTSGNKNGALPILAATVLATEPVRLTNVPRIRDVQTMVELLVDIGAEVEWSGDELSVDTGNVHKTELDEELCRRIRASFLLAGPLLARLGRVSVPPPGGDVIGRRRLDPHIHALAELGVEIMVDGRYEMQTSGLRGKQIFLDEASVMATENAVMAAVLAEGETVLGNAACEPHVQDLCRFLGSLGARIDGIESNVLRIEGVKQLAGGDWRVAPDHIEVGSFIGLAATSGGDLTIEDVVPHDLISILPAFERLGVHVEVGETTVRVPPGQDLVIQDDLGGQIPKIEDGPWPSFPADLTSIAVVTATQAHGTILVFEKMFESRLFFVDKLVGMGARIILCDPHRVVVTGPANLYGERLTSPDIRAGMAMLIAALCADGVSTIGNVAEIDRGYERIDERLRALGASIERIEG